MKSQSFSFLIFLVLFIISLQISEKEIINIMDLPFSHNKKFNITINYPDENNDNIPISLKNTIYVKIESQTEDLNNYYYRYYYIKNNEKEFILDDFEYYNVPSKTLIIPEAKYILIEMKNKINNSIIYLKSELINNNKNGDVEKISQKFKNNSKLKSFFSLEDIEEDNFSIIIFFSTFCLATTASVILILFDLNEDKKIIRTYNLSTKDRVNQEYKNLRKTYINKNIMKFSFFLMKYTNPIFNIFSIYNYNHPRYIRFFISLIKILLNFLITILFLIIFIEDQGKKTNLKNFCISFIYSFFASIIIYIITKLITRLMGYNKIRKEIWKPKYESFRKYIFYTVKKDILFNSKWHYIRNRMISYTRICGNILLRDKSDDKYKTYAENKKRSCTVTSVKENSSRNSNLSSQGGEDKVSDAFFEKFTSNTYNAKSQINNNLLGLNPRRKKTFLSKSNNKEINSRLYIEKGAQSFSISKLGQNNLKLKTVQRIEDIRNRYILSINDAKFDETLEVDSFVKTYDNLEIETLENYTYISTDSMNNQMHKTSSESTKIFLNLITTLVVLLLLTLVDFGLICAYKFMKDNIDDNKNINSFVLEVCFLPVICQIISINFLFNYFFNLLISFFIFKCYGYEKRGCFKRFIFKLFIEKFVKYIYRIRLIINKYNKELEFIDR